MKSLIAFIKKEILAQVRTGKFVFLGILFVLFGVMNPAIAKITPWLLETMADSLAASGMTVTAVTVSAMDSWVQFYKNMPMALIAFVLIESGIFTQEYASGTLVLSLTKGLERYKAVVSKALMLAGIWTAGYWLCFLITYGYNAYFWDNSVASNLAFSVVCWWLFGIFVVSMMILFSVIFKSGTQVLAGTGGVILLLILAGMYPPAKEYLPTQLTNANQLIYGSADAESCMASVFITAGLTAVFFIASIPVFNRKQL